LPNLVKENGAWAPFSTGEVPHLVVSRLKRLITRSTGPYGCIGRPLALLNVRTTLARIVTAFDISFAPGENGRTFEAEAREKFTIGFGDLMISFKPRTAV
jgi:cytochrome P450